MSCLKIKTKMFPTAVFASSIFINILIYFYIAKCVLCFVKSLKPQKSKRQKHSLTSKHFTQWGLLTWYLNKHDLK